MSKGAVFGVLAACALLAIAIYTVAYKVMVVNLSWE